LKAMEWLTVSSLIVIGLAILIIEIIFVPGTTIVGLIGFVLMVIGVGLSFKYFGPTVGWMTTSGTTVLSGSIIYLAFKANVWGLFSLKSTIDSKVNEGETSELKEGAEGTTVSALRPVGKAELGSKIYEVKTLGAYLEPGTRIRIMNIQANQIVVEPLN